MKDNRKEALANYLGMEKPEKDLIQKDISQDNVYTVGRSEYLVLTDEEANKRAREDIERSLWAFNTSFILEHCSTYNRMSIWEYDSAKEALNEVQSKCCESANELVRALIQDMDEFVEDAICADGRGHFISMYDGCEHEEKLGDIYYYIYRLS